MTPEQELQRAHDAQRWLDDPFFKEAREYLEKELASLRRNVPIGQTDMHTILILYGQAVDRFYGFFEQLAQTGRFAKLHLDELEQRRKGLAERMGLYRLMGREGL